MCVDEEELYIRGEFDSLSARRIRASLEKCHDRVDCKSDEEIRAFVRGKFLLKINNQIRFDSQKFNEKTIVKESILSWIAVNSKTSTMLPHRIT